MAVGVINKIIITDEAVFDYEETLGFGWLNKRRMKSEVEEYIDKQNGSGRLLYGDYFRCCYLDEESGQKLMLFLYRTEKFRMMQNWDLRGICLADDWSQEIEDNGDIRHWLKGKIAELEKGDWVIEQQARAAADRLIGGDIIEARICGLSKEVINAIKYGNDQELIDAISVFQNAVGKWDWREFIKRKVDIPRKCDKCPE